MKQYEMVIGLEVHAQLNTKTKIFCSCPNSFGGHANAQVCPVCLGLPGSLPVLNQQALIGIIKAGLILDCEIASFSKFDRKNYFYPDLPKAYQISQYDLPICKGGRVPIELDGKEHYIQLNRIHLEEDAGKLLHEDYQGVGSAVDYNRTGTPLIEIVTEPNIFSAKEAFEYLTSLKRTLKYLDISDCNMEEGSLRCDVNISIRPVGETQLGTKAEIKNMNSFHGVEKAIAYEFSRQVRCLEKGEKIIQETRLWDADKQITKTMRSKEEAHDYRYFPDPDLTPIVIDEKFRKEIEKTIPESPLVRKKRLMNVYQLSEYDAGILIEEKSFVDFFEQAVELKVNPKNVCNWITTELLRYLKEEKTSIKDIRMTPDHLGQLVQLIESKKITGKAAKQVFQEILESGKNPQLIVNEKGLSQIQDEDEIEKIVDQVLNDNPQPIADFKSGNKNAIGFLVGQVMKLSKGKASPAVVNQLLNQKLSK